MLSPPIAAQLVSKHLRSHPNRCPHPGLVLVHPAAADDSHAARGRKRKKASSNLKEVHLAESVQIPTQGAADLAYARLVAGAADLYARSATAIVLVFLSVLKT